MTRDEALKIVYNQLGEKTWLTSYLVYLEAVELLLGRMVFYFEILNPHGFENLVDEICGR